MKFFSFITSSMDVERSAALYELGDVNGKDWFETYGDILLQCGTRRACLIVTASSIRHRPSVHPLQFCILQNPLSRRLTSNMAVGLQSADRGNPFGEKKKKEPTELDRLIEDISKMDIPEIDESSGEVADEIVRSVLAVDDPETLVGQEDKLKSLMKHPNAKVRSAAVWALGSEISNWCL